MPDKEISEKSQKDYQVIGKNKKGKNLYFCSIHGEHCKKYCDAMCDENCKHSLKDKL